LMENTDGAPMYQKKGRRVKGRRVERHEKKSSEELWVFKALQKVSAKTGFWGGRGTLGRGELHSGGCVWGPQPGGGGGKFQRNKRT